MDLASQNNIIVAEDGTEVTVSNEVLRHITTFQNALLDPATETMASGQRFSSYCKRNILDFVLRYAEFHAKNPMIRTQETLTEEEEGIERVLWCSEKNVEAKYAKYNVDSEECTAGVSQFIKYWKNSYTDKAVEFDRELFGAVPDESLRAFFDGAQLLGAEADRDAPFSREDRRRSDGETTVMKQLFDRFLEEFGKRILEKDCYDTCIGGLDGECAANLRKFVGWTDPLPSKEQYEKEIKEFEVYFYDGPASTHATA